MGRLTGKIAIVIGASRRGGSGWCAAETLAAEGARIFVAARRVERAQTLAEQVGGEAFRCDVADFDEVSALFAEIGKRSGHVDIVVCAAGQGFTGSIAEMDRDVLQQATAINYFGPVYVARHAFPLMALGGSIIYYSTLSATQVFPGSAPYACAKAALNALVRYAAVEFAPRGIRVNALMPGLIESPQMRRWAESGVLPAFLKEIPLGKGVDPYELARMIVWMAADAYSITGETIFVDGGNHLRRAAFPDEFPTAGIDAMSANRTV